MHSSASWWAAKARQFRAHLRATVSPEERAGLVTWPTPAQLALFDAMHVADRRHGLDVVASLRADGVTDPDLLLAGLLHDAGKGDTGVWPRVAYTLGQRYGTGSGGWPRSCPGSDRRSNGSGPTPRPRRRWRPAAGCSARTVALIRDQDAPTDPEFGELLRLADEAN